MSSKKTTVNLAEGLLINLDVIAEAQEVTRNRLISNVLEDYSAKNIDTALDIIKKQHEIEELKKGLVK